MALFGIGTILYVSLLMINAIAILNEERFLAKSMLLLCSVPRSMLTVQQVGWLSASRQVRDGFQQTYDQNGYNPPQPDAGMKARMIDLIGAVRTLMRSGWLHVNHISFYTHNTQYLSSQSIYW